MDFLPKEIEDIIINYKSQLEHTSKNNIVLNEMEKNKYWCRMCWDLCHKHIIPILKKCDCCEEPICIDCEFTFTDGNNGDECDDCFFHGLIYRSLIGIINRKFTDKEHNILCDMLFDLMPYEKQELCDFIYFSFEYIIHDNDLSISFPIIFNIIVDYIDDIFN